MEREANGYLGLELLVESYIHMLMMVVNLKENNLSEAWNSMVLAQNNVSFATKAGKGIFDFNVDNLIYYLHCYESAIFPPQTFLSTGSIIEYSECSICGKEYGVCDHIKGYAYMGALCFQINKKIREFREVSIVHEPASKLHRIEFVGDEGSMRDQLTWRKK